MPKLTEKNKFLDLSDYGRTLGSFFAKQLKNTLFTPVHVTLLFGFSGLIAVYFILENQYILAALFIILKSIIDAADGELARIKKKPSYFGRYLDSIFDIILNLIIFIAIADVTKTSLWLAISAFICVQLQGTLYNYYYTILRNISKGGDKTSRIFETNTPKAFPEETQNSVNIIFNIYKLVYGVFDKIIYSIDKNAASIKSFPNWFMTLVSLYGLGFQLLIIAFMLSLGLINYIIPFFITYSALIIVFILIRKKWIL